MPEELSATIDYLGQGGQGLGDVAKLMLSQGRLDPEGMRPFVGDDGRTYISVYVGGNGGNLKDPKNYKATPIQANGTLRRDEWNRLDEAVLAISETRLNGVQDLIDNNLVFTLGNAMGTTVLEYHDVSDALAAELTMDGVTRARGDRPVFTSKYLPLPIIHVDYEINARVLAASRNMGNALDVTSAERASRKVAEKLEAMLFTDTDYTFGEGSIKSYLNHGGRNQVSLSKNWDDSGTTGSAIVTEVLSLKQSSIDAKHYGPWMLYIPTSYETTLDEDYDATTPGTTIRERIMKISGLKGIKVVDTLTADNVLLVQMTSDVVRLVRGMGIQNVEWETEGKMITKYKVMTIQVPQVRADQAGNSGIVHLA